MTKRKKKDRFYVEILHEITHGPRIWSDWNAYKENRLKENISIEKRINIDQMSRHVKRQIYHLQLNPEINALQSFFGMEGLSKVSFVIYRNWP